MLTLLRDLRRLRLDVALPRPDRGRSLAIRHVDAGSCNGCEHELTLTSGPYYDLQRYGLGVVASPRHADVLLVTGPVTTRMRDPLLTAYQSMPEPRLVAALGDCALGCGLLGSPDELVAPVPGRPPRGPGHRGTGARGCPGPARRTSLPLSRYLAPCRIRARLVVRRVQGDHMRRILVAPARSLREPGGRPTSSA
jgi:Ni,Fe-hydrogenase III small subunit